MRDLAGYEIGEQIYSSGNSFVYRGKCQADERPVILKFLNSEFPSSSQIARFKNEYALLQKLQSTVADVIRPIDFLEFDNSLVIVEEDIGGGSLGRLFSNRAFDLNLFFDLAIRITKTISALHESKVIHKDINPENIIWNPSENIIKVIDFGISSELTSEKMSESSLNTLEGTLEYISPEQTGRMNRSVDYRSDFYSLGACFYFLLTGKPPFQSDDRLEILHAQIAKEPISPSQFNSEVPASVAAIILKLLAKNAEDRYQSAFGLIHDLETARALTKGSDKDSDFKLGEKDQSTEFLIPQKLYGREKDIESIFNSFDDVCRGNRCLTVVRGVSGIGKSAMVHEVKKPIVQRHGHFIEGKFDQFNRDVPYSSIINAFKSLVRQILTESDRRIEDWKQRISERLGKNAGVITEVIQEVEQLIGRQPRVVPLRGAENQNRFKATFKAFVQSLSGTESPLVVFLDDLQWADHASIELIELLLTDEDIEGLLFVLAYRDNEVNASHPLTSLLKNINESKVPLRALDLAPLNVDHIKQLLIDSMGKVEGLCDLANLCHEKTQGNPFFLTRFLSTLIEEELINFNYSEGRWEWELEKIKNMGFTDNVLELMVDKIRKFSTDTQRVLQLASVLGNQFNLKILSWVAKSSQKQTADLLWPALENKLVSPINDSYRYVIDDHDSDDVEYQFTHDRIQQASYSLIPQDELIQLHFEVGMLLKDKLYSDQQHESMFEILNHLNKADIALFDEELALKVAKLNLSAARKASSASAYDAAIKYLNKGVEFLRNQGWDKHHDLCFALHVEIAETSVVMTDYDTAEPTIELLDANAKSTKEKLQVATVKTNLLITQAKASEIIELGHKTFTLIGMKFPRKPNRLQAILTVLKTIRLLKKYPTETLLSLPKLEDQEMIEAMRLMQIWGTACYQNSPELCLIVTCRMIELSTKHGNSSSSAFAYAHFGAILAGMLNKVDEGYALAKMSFELIDKYNFVEYKSKVKYLFHVIIQGWKDHTQQSIDGCEEAYWSHQESGDFDFATMALGSIPSLHLRLGTPLDAVIDKGNDIIDKLVAAGFERGTQTGLLFQWYAMKFHGLKGFPKHWPDEWKDEETVLKFFGEDNGTLQCIMLVLKLQYEYTIENFEAANLAYAEATANLQKMAGISYNVNYQYYGALNQAAQYNDLADDKKRSAVKIIKKAIKKLKKWSANAPINFEQKHLLLEAELNRIKQAPMGVILGLYDKSIALAQKNGYLTEEALANELAAFYLDSLGHTTIAKTYLQQARYLYSRWQAAPKLELHDSKYAHLLGNQGSAIETLASRNIVKGHGSTYNSTHHAGSDTFDLDSVLKTSQLIAGEIVLSSLLAKMMSVVLETAGAQKGSMIFIDGNKLLIEAEGQLGSENVEVLRSINVEDSQDLSAAIVKYVFRNQETLILSDASDEGDFTEDNYVKRTQPKSIICYPLLNQGELAGILYLENNLLKNAFTPERIKVLDIIASQIVISIDNAKLYGQLEVRNKRINQILLATKEMSRADSNIDAAKIAVNNLVKLDEKISLRSSSLILPKKNDETLVTYRLWDENAEIETPVPTTKKGVKKSEFSQLQSIIYKDQLLCLPIRSEKAFLGLLEISDYLAEAGELSEIDLSVFDGLSRSLALTMENIESQENNRLSGIGAMAASIVHDLKNPIGSILGYAELIEDNEASTTERNEYANIIKLEAKRMSAMAHEVLEFSQGEIQLNSEVLSSTDYIDDIAKTLRPIFDGNGIRFVVNNEYEGPLKLDGDRIRRVILNLATNARDAIIGASRNNSSTQKDYLVELSLRETEAGLTFGLRDTGPGIPKRIRATLFEPFVTEGKSHGTGLGMAIVKKIVDAHGGLIRFETELDKGTEFTLEFPQNFEAIKAETKVEAPASEHISKQEPFGDFEILIAEDNPVSQQMLSKFVSKLHCKADVAANGFEVLKALKKKDYKIVLMDVEMPEMDGLEATRKIREKDSDVLNHSIPIIAMTGHSGTEAENACRDAGMNGILSKPIDLSQLKKGLDDYLI